MNKSSTNAVIWKNLPSTTRFALIGLGLVSIDDDGKPDVGEAPAALVERLNSDALTPAKTGSR